MDTNPSNDHAERYKILEMLAEGKISAEEATHLLGAIDHEQVSNPEEQDVPGAHWFRVRVTDMLTGRPKASISIPMRLVDWGLNLGTQFAPQIAQVHIEELNRMVRSGVEGKIIDVVDEEDGDHVEIFID